MPEQRQVAETYWSVCWKWIFPYPCRKTRIVTRWCYDFSYLHVSYRYVYTIYQGCELNILYRWRKFELTWSGDDFTLYFLTKCFGSKLAVTGQCVPTGVIQHLKNVLGPDPIKTLTTPQSTTRPKELEAEKLSSDCGCR